MHCLFILSTKSSGSSALQRRLAAVAGANLASATRHYMNETLYWTKAASVLGLPQAPLPFSEVPIPAPRARRELRAFIAANAKPGGPLEDLATEAGLFAAWTRIVRYHGPVFLEKSPHHLYQASVVELMRRYAAVGAADCLFIGLVRNPMDTLYSSWRRFGVAPAREERHWARAYETLLELKQAEAERTFIVRYEDLLSGDGPLQPIFERLGAEPDPETEDLTAFHSASVQKWRADRAFGFSLSAETTALAERFGYSAESLANPHTDTPLSGLARRPREAAYWVVSKTPKPLKERAARVKRTLMGQPL